MFTTVFLKMSFCFSTGGAEEGGGVSSGASVLCKGFQRATTVVLVPFG